MSFGIQSPSQPKAGVNRSLLINLGLFKASTRRPMAPPKVFVWRESTAVADRGRLAKRVGATHLCCQVILVKSEVGFCGVFQSFCVHTEPGLLRI